MNASLTFNGTTFNKSFDENGGSARQSITRGINTPDKLLIKSQDYVDSSTKVPGRRYTARLDRYDIDASNRKIVTSAYFVIAVPESATQVQLDAAIAIFRTMVADAAFVVAVTNNEN